MTFLNLPAIGVLAGLVGLAAALYALQQLRTRYREMTVVTTLFWRQVVDVAPVRKFRERFRHPLAYALILAICSLLWLGLAEPRFENTQDQSFYVLVIDGSAGMAAGNRFQQAVDQLERQVARLPSARRQVLWSGAEIRPLLNPGEHELLLRKRLERLSPEAAPASLERLIRQLSASRQGGQPTSVLVFGDAPVRQQVLDLVPSTLSVKRATAPAALQGNTGITALGISDAASGAWDKVDAFVDVQSTEDRSRASPSSFQIDLDGRAIPASAITPIAKDGSRGFVIQDLPAAGGLLTVRLAAADNLSLDNTASARLPSKPILRVLLSTSLRSVLGPVLAADPGVTIATDKADVVIRRAGEPVGGDGPALEFVSAATQPQAFLLTHPDTLDSAAVFSHAVDDIGLKQIDAMSLAQSSGRAVEVSIVAGRQWRFSVWDDLLSEDFNFTRSRAFPLFVANAVRWLAGTNAWYPSVAAGRPLVTAVAGERAPVLGASGRVLDPIGADFVPASAGELKLGAGEPGLNAGARSLSVSLLDADVTSGARDASLELANLARFDLVPQASLVTWLLLLALVLLALEWYLFQMGRMP